MTTSYAADVLHEPVTGVFVTQHSTAYNKYVATSGLCLLAEVGSTMHGVSQTSSGDDVDEMGICIEPPTEALGLGDFEQYEYRTKAVNERSEAGDIDRVIYGLKKFVGLAAKGNPTVLMPLFADEDLHVRYLNWAGKALRSNREMLLSKQAGRKFWGYLQGQRDRYLDPKREDSKHATRPELIEKYGWDTKTGYHALRLAIQGIELMRYHTIALPMAPANRDFLLDVRNGSYTKKQVTTMLDETYIPALDYAIINTDLPDKPDYDAINRWLSATYREDWNLRGMS